MIVRARDDAPRLVARSGHVQDAREEDTRVPARVAEMIYAHRRESVDGMIGATSSGAPVSDASPRRSR